MIISNGGERVPGAFFRDWLRTYPDDRDLSATTKRRPAAAPGDYNLAKCDVIDQICARIFAAGPAPAPA
ncbi:GrpB family protein [Paractinoplanes lichenicola]|uniref:GrpB family protein n=1 Tax=Paractinoplanes lichenicola TaxID=2802976 RepID=A0ABS1VZA9_9ACTN|nr:GrpB family protein [Actinoplanes lichenicola]MBL7259832.1 GrpB family protein [Actinoplanes lichenicola]